MKFAALFAWILWAMQALAQPGCPDPQATNYNATATSNDGSCLYPVTNYTPIFKANLPNELQEISGLTRGGAGWWGHNDSGYDADFFRIDPESGDIFQKVTLKNAQNNSADQTPTRLSGDQEPCFVQDS
jgi:hypothetical protein